MNAGLWNVTIRVNPLDDGQVEICLEPEQINYNEAAENGATLDDAIRAGRDVAGILGRVAARLLVPVNHQAFTRWEPVRGLDRGDISLSEPSITDILDTGEFPYLSIEVKASYAGDVLARAREALADVLARDAEQPTANHLAAWDGTAPPREPVPIVQGLHGTPAPAASAERGQP